MESSDIVERLRERQQGMAEAIERLDSGEMDNGIMRVIRLESHDMYKTAADEIEKLRTDYALLSDDYRQLLGDVERLRAVLREVVPDLTEIVRMPNAEHIADKHNEAVRRLREALK